MNKRLPVLLATAAMALSPLLSVPSADATTLYYRNCTTLAHRFHHGVSKSRAAALYQVRQGYGMPAYGPLARRVYWKNHTRLDRDRDGTACER